MQKGKILLLILAVGVFLNISAASNSYGEDNSKLIFREDFEKGFKGWNKKGSNIEIMTGAESGEKYLKISRNDRREFTYISKEFSGIGIRGTLIFEVMMKAENVVRGTKDFHRGKFQGVVIVNGKEVEWPDDDFEGSFPWMLKRFEVLDLTGKETVVLRIGLQNAKGVVFVDDIMVFHVPTEDNKKQY